MSVLLDDVARDFGRRMALRRRMLGHMAISLTDSAALEHRADVRATLLGCGGCPSPDACARWVDDNCPGLPMFCGARDAFLRLEAASQGAPVMASAGQARAG